MRLPTIEKYDTSKKIDIIHIPKICPVNKIYVVMNDKDKIKFIKMLERIVRQSIEYKHYIQFLKSEIDMTKCTFFSNVSNKNNQSVSIEIHHEPFTLFDIVSIVVDKYIDMNLDLNPLTIAEEVMKLHYKDLVGLVPLSVTVHQLVHDGKLFIPLQNVYGNYISFIEEYAPYISPGIENILQAKLKISKEIDALDTSILEKKYVYLEVEGFNLPQIIER